jgi:hypothetical protein
MYVSRWAGAGAKLYRVVLFSTLGTDYLAVKNLGKNSSAPSPAYPMCVPLEKIHHAPSPAVPRTQSPVVPAPSRVHNPRARAKFFLSLSLFLSAPCSSFLSLSAHPQICCALFSFSVPACARLCPLPPGQPPHARRRSPCLPARTRHATT